MVKGMDKLEEIEYRRDILNAVLSVYPVIVSANLTKNTYRKLECQPLLGKEVLSEGTFDDLISNGFQYMESEFRQIFRELFSREALKERFLSGERDVYGEIKQICADGKEHWLEIHAICTSRGEELREICLVRIIDDQKEQERNWNYQLSMMNDELKERENSLKKALEYEKLTNECMRIFYHVENLRQSVERVMELTADYFQVDRSFVCEVHHDRIFNTYEWCAQGVPSKKEFMQDMDIHMFDCWMPLFIQEKYAICHNPGELPEEAELLRTFLEKMKIRQMVLIPISFDDEIKLFLGYDNPKFENENFISMMDTLIAIAMVGINRVYMERKRNLLTYKDSLTSLWNRTRMNEDIGRFERKRESAGILFLDVNGLKEINDNYNHEAGDMLLKACARVMIGKFPRCILDEEAWTERAYRIGGDEFVIWLRNITKEGFEKAEKELRAMYQETEDCSVSIGCAFMDEADNIFEMIKKADHLMYRDKKRYYEERKRKRNKEGMKCKSIFDT